MTSVSEASNGSAASAWERIEHSVKGIHGWTPIDQLFALFVLTISSREIRGDIVEVGSWCGRSAVVLASAAKIIGNVNVHCIDLFPEKRDWKQNRDGTYSFETVIDGTVYKGNQQQTVWKDAFETQTLKAYHSHDSILECFTENVKSRNLEDIVKPFRGDLPSFSQEVGGDFRCRLAFLDGDHGYDAVCQDIQTVEKFLSPGGWICFDDAFSSYDGVDKAITELVIQSPNFECFQQLTRKFFVARKR